MSSSPLPPEAPDIWADAAKAAPLGAAAFLARGLLSQERLSWGYLIRSGFSAAIVAVVVGLAIRDHIASESLRFACVGLAGFSAPELVDAAIRWTKAKAEAKVREAEAKLKPTRGKTPKPSKAGRKRG
jgi:hypothetical protein